MSARGCLRGYVLFLLLAGQGCGAEPGSGPVGAAGGKGETATVAAAGVSIKTLWTERIAETIHPTRAAKARVCRVALGDEQLYAITKVETGHEAFHYYLNALKPGEHGLEPVWQRVSIAQDVSHFIQDRPTRLEVLKDAAGREQILVVGQRSVRMYDNDGTPLGVVQGFSGKIDASYIRRAEDGALQLYVVTHGQEAISALQIAIEPGQITAMHQGDDGSLVVDWRVTLDRDKDINSLNDYMLGKYEPYAAFTLDYIYVFVLRHLLVIDYQGRTLLKEHGADDKYFAMSATADTLGNVIFQPIGFKRDLRYRAIRYDPSTGGIIDATVAPANIPDNQIVDVRSVSSGLKLVRWDVFSYSVGSPQATLDWRTQILLPVEPSNVYSAQDVNFGSLFARDSELFFYAGESTAGTSVIAVDTRSGAVLLNALHDESDVSSEIQGTGFSPQLQFRDGLLYGIFRDRAIRAYRIDGLETS